ncbi:MAG: HAD family hydrolase [Candidatus Thorarchaeota archaeon]
MPIIISDLDGTILDVRKRFVHAQINSLKFLGFDISPDDILPLVQFTMDASKFLGGLNLSLSNTQFREYILQIEQEFYKGWTHSYVIPGVIKTLNAIRPKLDALRLITSRAWLEETEREVERFGLNEVFDNHVYSRGHLARSEGVEEIPLYPFDEHRQRLIRLAIADLKNHGEVWVIGDSPEEMQAAKGLGYITIGVLTGFASKEDLAPYATYVLDSVADLDQLI